jgi:hypothetical protein
MIFAHTNPIQCEVIYDRDRKLTTYKIVFYIQKELIDKINI